MNESDSREITVGIVACNYVEDVKRAVKGAFRWANGRDMEAVILDNGSTDGTSEWLESLATSDGRVRVIHADHKLGEGAAKNIVLKQSLGRTVILLDTSAEIREDIFGRIEEMLDQDGVGVAGPFGLRTDNLHHFHDGEGESGEMDAMQAYCFAFRRSSLREVGPMRESFRFYRNLDIDYSFHFKRGGQEDPRGFFARSGAARASRLDGTGGRGARRNEREELPTLPREVGRQGGSACKQPSGVGTIGAPLNRCS